MNVSKPIDENTQMYYHGLKQRKIAVAMTCYIRILGITLALGFINLRLTIDISISILYTLVQIIFWELRFISV